MINYIVLIHIHKIARILFSRKIKSYVCRFSRDTSAKALPRTVPSKILKNDNIRRLAEKESFSWNKFSGKMQIWPSLFSTENYWLTRIYSIDICSEWNWMYLKVSVIICKYYNFITMMLQLLITDNCLKSTDTVL